MPEPGSSDELAAEGRGSRSTDRSASVLRSMSLGEAVAVVVLAILVHGALHWGVGLYDTDGYTHLGLARAYAEDGIPHRVETARFSAMHEGFGDKEWFFHALLVPAVMALPPLAAGNAALIGFNVLLALVLAAIGRFLVGRWGLLLPFVLPLLSLETAWRLVRLRPELLALSLMLVALVFLAERRPWSLLAATFLFTWSYTAFHALLGVLCLAAVALLLHQRTAGQRIDGRLQLRLFLAPPLGAAAGLVLHPHFPHNLAIWLIQNVQFFRAKDVLDAGTEIRPNLTSVMLQANLGWWLVLLLVLGAVIRGRTTADGGAANDAQRDRFTRLAIAFGTAAVVFVALYLLMSRFSLYAFPLTTLTLLSAARASGRELGSRWSIASVGSVPVRPLFLLVVLVALGLGAREWTRFRDRTDLGPDRARLTEWQRIDELLSRDTRVAADWRTTGVLGYWAPARYLNLLDPVFMAFPHPERHRALRAVLAGDEPDVVAALRGPLDSEVLAVSVARAAPRLLARLRSDPRLEVLHDGTYLLVRDVSIDVPASAWLADGWEGVEGTRSRRDSASARAATGFVVADGFESDGECFTVARTVAWPADAVGLEFAPNGPGLLRWNGAVVASVQGDGGAIHGRALRLPIPGSEVHREPEREPGASGAVGEVPRSGSLVVSTCRPRNGSRTGFYLRVLRR